ncbi:helix-turn-helix domain-containing protein [Alicyclobacillus macrosporangiidus]|uniref:Helix-turn-helix n=1 Tax=Alicyclobacillus macrosporangiidus TaxID=392015 RepID=A0A1I7JA56_9BACL|nr:helix-turn-helix transcriptional regulator [Alicyclobacillus macrosporangiidus]SFU82034.1 Helix-turn-helix [Alicyclobacillus macrosporangiidus]
MANFAERLSELIETNGVSKKDLAAILGVTYRNLRRYETGERKPDFDGLIKLADFFNVSLDYLVGRTDDPTPPPRSSS